MKPLEIVLAFAGVVWLAIKVAIMVKK